jgi:hypothetical protein
MQVKYTNNTLKLGCKKGGDEIYKVNLLRF